MHDKRTNCLDKARAEERCSSGELLPNYMSSYLTYVETEENTHPTPPPPDEQKACRKSSEGTNDMINCKYTLTK